jgi:hypothetical protein
MMVLCNRIEEFSVEYLREELCKDLKIDFEKHLELCSECKNKFMLIKANFKKPYTSMELPVDFNSRIMNSIDKSRYKRNRTIQIRKRIVLAATVIVTLGLVTGFSEPISNKINELIYKIQGRLNVSKLESTTKATKLTQEKAKEIYEGYANVAEETLKTMKVGDVKTIELDNEEISGIILKLYKSDKNDVVNLCIGDEKWRVKGEHLIIFETNKTTVEKIIDEGSFIAVLDPLPDGKTTIEVNDMRQQTGRLFINHKFGDGSIIGVELAKSSNFTTETNRELVKLNALEGIYEEVEGKNGREGRVSFFLGEDAKQRALVIRTMYSQQMTEERFLEIIRNIKFYNESANKNEQPTPKEYFKGVVDLRLADKYDEFLKKVRDKSANFNIKIDEGVTLSGYKNTDINYQYGIDYENKSFEDIVQYMNYPLVVNKDIFSQSIGNKVRITGYGFSEAKIIHGWLDYKFGKERKIITFEVFPIQRALSKYSIMDITIEQVSEWEMESSIILDRNNNAYIIYKAQENTVFRTIKKYNNRYITYQISVPPEILKDTPYETFINELEFIEP